MLEKLLFALPYSSLLIMIIVTLMNQVIYAQTGEQTQYHIKWYSSRIHAEGGRGSLNIFT